ncbi:MAG: DNA/RNA non-specific endonuclease [Gemmatimonadetes bacterium]|nr:DNA/RNA non-specific endonuclease [Gemmatimonadota bacterium]
MAVPQFRRIRLLLALAPALLAACAPDAVAPTASAPEEASYYTYPSAIYRSHVEFGTPYDASTTNDYVIHRRTHSLSHHCGEGGPNWVSWNLNKTHYGDAPRSTSFTADTGLPTGCYRVVSSDYTNSGYDRGHMVRSEERTWSSTDNQATFVMTNVLPQRHDLNAGPWLKFETYLQGLAQNSNKEIYVISGGRGNAGTLLGAGKVVIPTHTWKIAVVMPYGHGLAQATSNSSLQVIAVMMPNTTGIISAPWTNYKTTVDNIEYYTKYNFLDKLPDSIESYWESRVY